jgi:hypothetical protein
VVSFILCSFSWFSPRRLLAITRVCDIQFIFADMRHPLDNSIVVNFFFYFFLFLLFLMILFYFVLIILLL